ncbi:MAG TPA: tripartite tricarboxylate transporter substrate-binding protein, partial [Chloroflexota bacterium]|nr:tripartite tricarboxylate transporter substrate-binding protein [Chloroflexota bacterium]
MKRLLVSLVAVLALASLVVTGCSQSAPAPAPTKAAEPAKAAEPTKAAAPAAQPTAAAPAAASKTSWPEKGKSITCIVASDAGGSSDVGARLISAYIEKELGVSIQVVNKPGAGWQVGLTELSKAKPDGYTFGMAVMPQANTIYLDPERKA